MGHTRDLPLGLKHTAPIGEFLYGITFVVGVPLFLVWWATRATVAVPLPVPAAPWAGAVVGSLGLILVIAGWWALYHHGNGLPMNPFPPRFFVTRGIYRYTSHPVYIGFCLLVLGASLVTESRGGLWLVTPMTMLACAALVLGYEREATRHRFGPTAVRKPLIALPRDTPGRPNRWNRVSVYLMVLLPWAAAFEAVYRLGVPRDARSAYLPFERPWPVLEWSEPVYASVYLLVLLAPLIVTRRDELRRFAVRGLLATAIVTPIYLIVPLVAPPRPFAPSTVWGDLLMFERSMSHTVAAFPAFHVIWTLIAADAWRRTLPRAAPLIWVWAALITISCVTTGMHAIVDVVMAIIVFLVVRHYRWVWSQLQTGAERVANSWREWRHGNVRLINHGIYAGAAGLVGFTLAASFAGPDLLWAVLLIHLTGLGGAALWAQRLEGSPALSRPFGYYGSVIGALGGCLLAGILGADPVVLLAAVAIEAPWMQGIGRFRCLVQGCCHGRPAPPALGIRYYRSRSRVTKLAGLRGEFLHPTPVYSMIANAVIGLLLLRLWTLGASMTLIAGGYLMLAGLARFVEESYRGEPQTPIVGGLRLYQWAAVVSLGVGILLTTLSPQAAPPVRLVTHPEAWLGAVIFGVLATCAMGVDFPASRRRYARLAPAPEPAPRE